MAEPLQGEIWWAQLPHPVGHRPVIVLTRNTAIARLANVTVAPLTRSILDIESQAIISPEDGVPELSAASLDNILTIPKHRLERRITRVSDETMLDVWRALRAAFAMPS
ncbi:MAG: type II toxin-antitoxin system PemK/MazF family toxin [Phycisphaeraceae bacterium]